MENQSYAQMEGQEEGGRDSTWPRDIRPGALAARLGAVDGTDQGVRHGQQGDDSGQVGEEAQQVAYEIEHIHRMIPHTVRINPPNMHTSSIHSAISSVMCSFRSEEWGIDRIRPIPRERSLLALRVRASGDVPGEMLLAIGRDGRGNDPRLTLLLDCARMRLAKVRTKDLAVLGQTEFAGEFLRRVCLRHGCHMNRPFVRSDRFIRSMNTAYHRSAHMCRKHSVNIRTRLPIVRSFDRSTIQRSFAMSATSMCVVAFDDARRPLHAHEGGIDDGKFFRERSEKTVLVLVPTQSTYVEGG